MDVQISVLLAAEPSPETASLLAHYRLVGPILESLFGPIPLVRGCQDRPGGGVFYQGPLGSRAHPHYPCVDVVTRSGTHRYPCLAAERIEAFVRRGAAVEAHGWSPAWQDPSRAAFARIILATTPHTRVSLIDAVCTLRDTFLDAGYRSILVLDGAQGATLWIPFHDGPSYDHVRLMARAECEVAAGSHPELFTLEPNTSPSTRVHLHWTSNAVGRFSMLPYSARATQPYRVALPIPWELLRPPHPDEPLAPDLHAMTLDRLPTWLETHGDVFARELVDIGAQHYYHKKPKGWKPLRATEAPAPPQQPPALPAHKTHGPIVAAAIAVLQDGRSHTAEEILAAARAQHLLDAATTQKYVYTSLIEYIARARGNGRKPAIVQDPDRTFRANEPPDPWPALDPGPPPPPSPQTDALIERLERTASGHDADAFERAVCDAFDALGFVATHVGGQKAPDGYADALLGPLGYRVMLECKSAGEGVNDPNVFESAKYRDAYGARFCALVARAFSGELELTKELQNHGVSAWTVDDLHALLRLGSDPLEMQPLFAPGFAADALDDLLWERRHGRRKRVRWIADALLRTGRTTQLAYHGAPSEAPRITEDVAMVLVDQDLAAHDSPASCARDEVRAAVAYLVNPLVGAARQDPADGSLVVT